MGLGALLTALLFVLCFFQCGGSGGSGGRALTRQQRAPHGARRWQGFAAKHSAVKHSAVVLGLGSSPASQLSAGKAGHEEADEPEARSDDDERASIMMAEPPVASWLHGAREVAQPWWRARAGVFSAKSAPAEVGRGVWTDVPVITDSFSTQESTPRPPLDDGEGQTAQAEAPQQQFSSTLPAEVPVTNNALGCGVHGVQYEEREKGEYL